MSPLPLDGIRVLDLSRLLPGGFCSLLLADFGAEVVKVEDTGAGDYLRWTAPRHAGVEDSAASAAFLSLNRNKTSIRVDLKSEDGREVLLRLVRDADVLLESFRPGVLDRLVSELDERRRDGREERRKPSHGIERPAGDAQRDERGRDRHDAHVHRHVRRERA